MAKYTTETQLNCLANSIVYRINEILASGFDVENLTDTEAEKIYNKLNIALSKILDVKDIVL